MLDIISIVHLYLQSITNKSNMLFVTMWLKSKEDTKKA